MTNSILEWLWRIVEMGKALLAVNQVRRHIQSLSVYISLSSQAHSRSTVTDPRPFQQHVVEDFLQNTTS
jgi:hypothetical protein